MSDAKQKPLTPSGPTDAASASQQASKHEPQPEVHKWAVGCLLGKHFAVNLVQECPGGAHDLKAVFFSDFDDHLQQMMQEKQDAENSAKGGGRRKGDALWKKVAQSRKPLVAAMTGVIESDGGDFCRNPTGASQGVLDVGNENHTSALTSSTTQRAILFDFGNAAKAVMMRRAARTLIPLNSFTFVQRCMKVLSHLGVVSFPVEEHILNVDEAVEALRWRMRDGLGLRAPHGLHELPRDFTFVDESPEVARVCEEMDPDLLSRMLRARERRKYLLWERELRERWYLLRDVPSMEGHLLGLSSHDVLAFCLLDLFHAASAGSRADGNASLIWGQLVEYLGDCSTAGGTPADEVQHKGNKKKSADSEEGEHKASDAAVAVMNENIKVTPFSSLSRASVVAPFHHRNLLLVYEMDRDGTEAIHYFDYVSHRPSRLFQWPSHYGKITNFIIASNLNAIIVSTFDVVRVVDIDNYICKFSKRVDPITTVQWVADCMMLVVGCRVGCVHAWVLKDLDHLYFSKGSQCISELPEKDTHFHPDIHSDAIAHVGDRCLPGTAILISSLDSTLTSWSVESGMVRRMIGAVALGFEIVSSLGLVFAYGVDLFPLVWPYTVANSRPTVVGGTKKGYRPHQGKIIGVAVLPFPKNCGISIDRMGGVMVWDLWELCLLQSWNVVDKMPATLGNLSSLTFTSFFWGSSKNDSIVVWSKKFLCDLPLLKQEDATSTPVASNFAVQSVAYCPELRLFITAQRNSLTVWNGVTCSPMVNYQNLSPHCGDEITRMHVYETPNREVRVGTKCGCVVTVAIGSGAIRDVYQHRSHREIQCFAFVPLLDILVVSTEHDAKSIMRGDEKSFFVSQSAPIGFSDVCVHKATRLLVAVHDEQVRCTIWDVSPTTPNMWVKLGDYCPPIRYTRLSGGGGGETQRSQTSSFGEAKPLPIGGSFACGTVLQDFYDTPFFSFADTNSNVYICQIDIRVSSHEEGHDETEHRADGVLDENVEENLEQIAKAAMSVRRSTLVEKCEHVRQVETPEDVALERDHAVSLLRLSTQSRDGESGSHAHPSRKAAKDAEAVRIIDVLLRQVLIHRLHAPTKDEIGLVPKPTACTFVSKFAFLYVADDMGYVSIYDVAGVLLRSLSPESLAHSPSAIVNSSHYTRRSFSVPATSRDAAKVLPSGAPTLAEQIWGRDEQRLSVAKAQDDQVDHLGDAARRTSSAGSCMSQAPLAPYVSSTADTPQDDRSLAVEGLLGIDEQRYSAAGIDGVPDHYGNRKAHSPASKRKVRLSANTPTPKHEISTLPLCVTNVDESSPNTRLTVLPPSPKALMLPHKFADEGQRSSRSTARSHHCSEGDARDSLVGGAVFLVHTALIHDHYTVTSIAVLDSPLASLITSGTDRLVNFSTLYLQHCGRLAMGQDSRESLFDKFLKARQVSDSLASSGRELSPKRSNIHKQAVVPRSLGAAVNEHNSQWEKIFAGNQSRLSIFDDVPPRFRSLKRHPIADWEVEVETVEASGFRDSLSSPVLSLGLPTDEGPPVVKLPMKPILCDWDTLKECDEKDTIHSAVPIRQSFALMEHLRFSEKAPTATAAKKNEEPNGVISGAEGTHGAAQLLSARQEAEHRHEAGDAGSFFLTAQSVSFSEDGSAPTSPHHRRVKIVPQGIPAVKRLPKKTASQLRLTHEQKVLLCQDWFFENDFLLGTPGRRSVENYLLLKQMGDANMEDVVNEVLLKREEAEERTKQQAVEKKRQREMAKITTEMKSLFGNHDEKLASLMMQSSWDDDDERSSMKNSPTQQSSRGGKDWRPSSPSTASSVVYSLAPGQEALGGAGAVRCVATGDEAWLSRLVLKQLDPQKNFLPVPVGMMIESKLVAKHNEASGESGPPPSRIEQLMIEERDMAAIRAQHEYKAAQTRLELMSPVEKAKELSTLERMPLATFQSKVLRTGKERAFADAKKLELLRQQEKSHKEMSLLHRTMESMVRSNAITPSYSSQLNATANGTFSPSQTNFSALSSSFSPSRALRRPVVPLMSSLEQEIRAGKVPVVKRGAGGPQSLQKQLEAKQRLPALAMSRISPVPNVRSSSQLSLRSVARQAVKELTQEGFGRSQSVVIGSKSPDVSDFFNFTAGATLNNRLS